MFAILPFWLSRVVIVGMLSSFCLGCASGSANGNLVRNLGVLTVAVAGDLVLVGQSFSSGKTGRFELYSMGNDPFECKGRYRYINLPKGSGRFSCSNGEKGFVKIKAERGASGTGAGDSSFGPVQVVFGYSVAEANARLVFPQGGQLVQSKQGIFLMHKHMNKAESPETAEVDVE